MPTNTKNLTLPEYRETRDSFFDGNVVCFHYGGLDFDDNILEATDGPYAGQFEVVLGNDSTIHASLADAECHLYRHWYLPERANSDGWENKMQVRLFNYCAKESLPFLSADELLAQDSEDHILTASQRSWLAFFVHEWDTHDKSVNEFVKKHGWYLMNTGGGCTGFARDLPDGGYYLLTESDDVMAPTDLNTPCNVGRYDAEGETVEDHALVTVPTTKAAILLFS